MSRIPEAVIAEVDARADDHCEACGGRLWYGHMSEGAAYHHRQPLSAGGMNTTDNLIKVHHGCHNVAEGSIHQNPARSYALGHLVRRGHEPTNHPVIVRRDLRQLVGIAEPESDCTCLEMA